VTNLFLKNIQHETGDICLSVPHWQLRPGQLTGIVGPNGAGKTSLLKIAAGLIRPDQGEIGLGTRDDTTRFGDRLVRAQQIADLPQFQPLVWPMACRDIVALGRLAYKSDFAALSPQDWACVDAAMARCAVSDFAGRAIDQLSGGERARVLVARLMAADPALYLLDEPAQSLDPAAQLAVMSLMRQEAEAGKAVVMVLHDLNLAARYCDQVVGMHRGEIVFEGPPKQVFTPSNLRPIFNVDMHQVDGPHGLLMQASDTTQV
jgi:iron complex transport system ATP-binding protein